MSAQSLLESLKGLKDPSEPVPPSSVKTFSSVVQCLQTDHDFRVQLGKVPEIWEELQRILTWIAQTGLEPNQVEWVMYLLRVIRNACANVTGNQLRASECRLPEQILEIVSQAANMHYGNQKYILLLRSGVQALSNLITGNDAAQDFLLHLLLDSPPSPNFDQNLLSTLAATQDEVVLVSTLTLCLNTIFGSRKRSKSLVSSSAGKKLLRQLMVEAEAASGTEERQSFEMIFTLIDHMIDHGLFPELFEALEPLPEDLEESAEPTAKKTHDELSGAGLERMQHLRIDEVTDEEAAKIQKGEDDAQRDQNTLFLSAEQVALLKILDSRVFSRHEKQHQQLAHDPLAKTEPFVDLGSVKAMTDIFGVVSSLTIEILQALDEPGKSQHEVENLANLTSGLLLLLACFSNLCLFDDGLVTTSNLDEEAEAGQTQGELIPIPDWFKAQHLVMVQAGIVENAIELLRQADVSLAKVSKPVDPANANAASTALGANSTSTLLSDTSTMQGQKSFFTGMKRDIVRLVGNLAYRSQDVQDRVRSCNGLVVMLGQCNIDDANPYLREYAILAMKHLLTGNLENQKLVSELQPIEAVDHPALQEARIQANLDSQGRPVLSSRPAPPQ